MPEDIRWSWHNNNRNKILNNCNVLESSPNHHPCHRLWKKMSCVKPILVPKRLGTTNVGPTQCHLLLHFGLADPLGKQGHRILIPSRVVLRCLHDQHLFKRKSVFLQWTRLLLPQFDSWVRKIRWRRDKLPTPVFLGFPCGSAGKESACNAGDLGSIPGLGRFPGEGKDYPLQYSVLENSMDCIVHGGHKQSDATEQLSLSLSISYG